MTVILPVYQQEDLLDSPINWTQTENSINKFANSNGFVEVLVWVNKPTDILLTFKALRPLKTEPLVDNPVTVMGNALTYVPSHNFTKYTSRRTGLAEFSVSDSANVFAVAIAKKQYR